MKDIVEQSGYLSQGASLFWAMVVISIFLLLYIFFSIGQRRKLKESLHSNTKAIEHFCDISKHATMIVSAKGKIVYLNASMQTMFQYKQDTSLKDAINKAEIKINREWMDINLLFQEKVSLLSKDKPSSTNAEIRFFRKQSIEVNLYFDSVKIGVPDTQKHLLISIEDLRQEQERSREKFQHQVTQLPNQLQAYQDLPAFFSKAHLNESKLALVLLHLDNFTMLRSVIGYEQSNTILKKFATYLSQTSKELNISIYHTFDNHFLMTLPSLNSIDEVKLFVEKIQESASSFYKMQEVNLHLTLSCGIAVYPDSGNIHKLLDFAYKALVEAEKAGDGNINVYIPEQLTSNYDELKLYNHMQMALTNGEFEVYYQPLVEVSSMEIVAAEALIRWRHPQYGFISPEVFIGLMEKTGFIVKLGKYILDTVLKQQKRWEIFKFKSIEVSINVSMAEINTGEFVQEVERKLKETQVSPNLIKFEITEGMAMINEFETVNYFLALKKLGVGISLDDFGTGYTSFGYLKKFPADNLKIDKSLVDHIINDTDDQRIVKAIIELAHTLGMKIVVEGIETKEMVDIIASYGCDYMQGYYFSKPLPVFEFQKLLR